MENAITEKFINEENIEVCIQTNDIKSSKTDKKRVSNIFSNLFKKEKEKEQEINDSKQSILPLFITDDLNCPHNLNKLNDSNENSDVKIPYHAYNIKDLISKFSDVPWKEDPKFKYEKPRKLILNEIALGSKNNQIYKSLNMYMDIIKKHLIQPTNEQPIFKDFYNSKKNINKTLEKIKDYITRQIYKYVYPSKQIGDDVLLYNNIKKLQWITPEQLKIKITNVPNINNAISLINRFDFYKSIKDKLNCIDKIYNNMRNEMKLYYGTNDESNKEELKYLFCYIVIKALPKRMMSNINYIKCFEDYNEINSYLVTLLETSKEFLNNITYKCLNIKKEEFDKNMNNS